MLFKIMGDKINNMGKKLAFWGDCNGNGYEIIRILEELGGVNVSNYCANEVTSLYYIDEKNHIKGTYNGDLDKEKYVIMTYHEFIAKYPHQVYDIVYAVDNHEEGEVVEVIWDETKGRMRYLVTFENSTSWVFVDDIFSYEAKDNSDIETTGFMQLGKTFAVIFNDANYEDEVELQLGDYEIEVRDGKTYAVRKKSVFPKNYEECCQHLGCDDKLSVGELIPFQQLINARNAYWKIYGEEMGLGKSWEPNWTTFEGMPAIFRFRYNIVCDTIKDYHCLLVFPSTEMRDALYENFKDLIERCKELL